MCQLRESWIIAAVSLGIFLFGCEGASEKGSSGTSQSRPVAGTGILVIAYAPDSADTFTAFGPDSLTALAWLQQACGTTGLPLVLDSYSFGDLVIRIGPRQNGDGGYWLYKVNGGMVPESASGHRVSADDTVLFFFE